MGIFVIGTAAIISSCRQEDERHMEVMERAGKASVNDMKTYDRRHAEFTKSQRVIQNMPSSTNDLGELPVKKFNKRKF